MKRVNVGQPSQTLLAWVKRGKCTSENRLNENDDTRTAIDAESDSDDECARISRSTKKDSSPVRLVDTVSL